MEAQPGSSQTRLRDRLPFPPRRETNFRWRGTEVSRVEGFTDAVFAFGVTLLVVALEVPTTFDGLLDVLRGFPAFVICFTILMLFWNAHYTFHRRYGLDDTLSRVLTMGICVLVLFFVYPLKFLFTILTVAIFDLQMAEPPRLDGPHQVRELYVIYGLGFAGVAAQFASLYGHAWVKRSKLALALATTSTWLPGFIYFLLGPLQAINGFWFARRIRAVAAS